MCRDTEIGHRFVGLAMSGFNLRAISFHQINHEKREERLVFFQNAKDNLINSLGKPIEFEKIYIFSMDGSDLKLSVDFTSAGIKPMAKEDTETLWKNFTELYPWINDDVEM